MAIPKKVINFLERNKIKYEPIEHKTVYSAFDKARTLKMKRNIIGKTLVLKTDRDLAVVLIPSNKNLDKIKFKRLVNDWRKKTDQKPVKSIEFASERLIKNKIKGVKLGATPPFGNMFKVPTFVNKSLLSLPEIIINSGHYNYSIKIKGDFLKKMMPDLVVGSFTKTRK
ncbi:MAG: aminoacyl-tRNA deacylase [Candidatus Nealsonbacteria bacterium]